MKSYSDFINEAFKVGDRVSYDTSHRNFDDASRIENGTIIYIDDGRPLVKFDNKWSYGLHAGGGIDPDWKSYWCSVNNLKKEKTPKIVISAEDPYGEEDWGEE